MQKKQKTGLSIGFLIILINNFQPVLQAQDKFWENNQAYLGQVPPEEEPKIFANQLLKDSGIVLGKVCFAKNGRAFYYSYAAHWFDDSQSGTKEIRFDGKKWLKPVVIAERITNPAFSPDYKKLYLGGSNGQVWVMNRKSNGWFKPGIWMEKSYGLYNFQATNSGTFYTGSNGTQGSKKDWSTYDFCKMTITNKDTVISSLGTVLNTPGFDGDFFIAPDESYIIISTKETKNFESELWISFRKKNKTWTAPQSLGDKINDGLAHRFGQYVSPDGKYLFYTRGTSESDCAIYWVRFDRLFSKLRSTVIE